MSSSLCRLSELIRACDNVHPLPDHFVEAHETLVEEVHHATTARTVYSHTVPFRSADLDTVLRFPEMASGHIHSPESIHARFIRRFLLQDIREETTEEAIGDEHSGIENRTKWHDDGECECKVQEPISFAASVIWHRLTKWDQVRHRSTKYIVVSLLKICRINFSIKFVKSLSLSVRSHPAFDRRASENVHACQLQWSNAKHLCIVRGELCVSM